MKGLTAKHVLIHLAIILVIGFVALFAFFNVYLPKTTKHGESITVPNLQGRPFAELEQFMEEHKLRYEVNDSTFSAEFPPMTVMKQYPMAGAQVKENRKIFISLNAQNPPKVRMPNLIDGSVKNAQLVLKSFGLELGEITYEPNLAANAVLKQQVKGQPIAEGDYIAKGSKIDLVVGDGKGNNSFTLDNLMGQDIETAQFNIIGTGLQVGEIHYESVPDKAPNTVLRHIPPAGATVQTGETVDLWVVKFDPNQVNPGVQSQDNNSIIEQEEE